MPVAQCSRRSARYEAGEPLVSVVRVQRPLWFGGGDGSARAFFGAVARKFGCFLSLHLATGFIFEAEHE
jgi:hypothetical protein